MAGQSTVSVNINPYDKDNNNLFYSIGSTERIVVGITTGFGENYLQDITQKWGDDGGYYFPSLDVSDKLIIAVWLKNYNKLVGFEDYTDFSEEIEGVKDYNGDVAIDFVDLFKQEGIDVSGFNFILAKEYVTDELQEFGSVFFNFKVDKDEEPIPEPTPSGSGRRKFYTAWLPSDEVMDKLADSMFIVGDNFKSGIEYFSSYKRFFVELTSSGQKTLRAGGYDYQIDCDYLDYVECDVDCGEIEVEELFKGILDYNPFSRLTMYLPFIGFVDVELNEVMGKKIQVVYTVDVLSGRCLAKLYSQLNDELKTCIAQYGGTIASDEMFGSEATREYNGTYELMTTNQLGELKAFVLVESSKEIGSGCDDYEGNDTEEVKKVGDCSGYVQFKKIRVSGVECSEKEKAEIENLLLNGILVD